MSVLHKIQIEAEGKESQIVYRKIYELQVESSPRRWTHQALYRYQKQELVVSWKVVSGCRMVRLKIDVTALARGSYQ